MWMQFVFSPPKPGEWRTLLDLAPILSSAVALLAVFVGPWVQMRIAKHQIEASAETAKRQQVASVVSSNRVRWIEEFRKEIAEFIAACHLHEIEKHDLEEAETAGDKDWAEQCRTARDASFLRVNTLLHTLRLKLEPTDPLRPQDQEIWDTIGRLDQLYVHEFESLIEFEKAFFAEVEPLSRAVRAKLSAEWKRVERLE
ncbi:hypothetical protein EAH89_17415 [Roseomonas nepalensis]|uniref:DUF4760 domain-containing protein n=1 Tax=Muricoccus nepalensis TaxID=1854500 RepID=A0A502FW69_9PROT|nr:hypothetical protein [Roseomonas nepalensis]TPG53296.1 hypothetical protein EAH89_17415 [Roseomonas nepalensis]